MSDLRTSVFLLVFIIYHDYVCFNLFQNYALFKQKINYGETGEIINKWKIKFLLIVED